MKIGRSQRALPGQALSDPVLQDSLKDWRLKTSSLKTHKDPGAALCEAFFPFLFGRAVVSPAMGPAL